MRARYFTWALMNTAMMVHSCHRRTICEGNNEGNDNKFYDLVDKWSRKGNDAISKVYDGDIYDLGVLVCKEVSEISIPGKVSIQIMLNHIS